MANSNQPGKSLKVGTLFSGIGAFEEALTQLGVPHVNVFACDNGEIELIPLEDQQEQKDYKKYQKKVRSLSNEEKEAYQLLKDKIAQRIELYRQECWALETQAQRAEYVENLYHRFAGYKTNWMKKTYLANHKLNEEDFHTDVRFLNGSIYAGKVGIIVGGNPCQSFSTYSKKQGLGNALDCCLMSMPASFSTINNKEGMTLLAAMKTVLEEKGKSMKIDELTDEINQRSLFQSKGGKPLLPWQVKAAARRYRATFLVSSDSISL